ncbi:MAG TPA: hypothetical protein VG034_08270 [Acidimicrobiia bacterium]|jgi:hypothetical protein|nr:hypothetical protein [Acidimicrobiia bacterium]
MARKKSAEAEPEVPLYWGMTPNQIVAYNLNQARIWKGWTQEQAADALAPYVGSRWSKANFSAAERSMDGQRIRNFDADEIVAFARTFELPVTFFFMPPAPWSGDLPVRLETPDAGRLGEALTRMVDLVFGERHNIGLLSIRLEQFLDQIGAEALTESQNRIRALADARVGKLVQKAFRDLERWQTVLRSMANHLEGMVTQAKAAVWDDVDLPEGYRQ